MLFCICEGESFVGIIGREGRFSFIGWGVYVLFVCGIWLEGIVFMFDDKILGGIVLKDGNCFEGILGIGGIFSLLVLGNIEDVLFIFVICLDSCFCKFDDNDLEEIFFRDGNCFEGKLGIVGKFIGVDCCLLWNGFIDLGNIDDVLLGIFGILLDVRVFILEGNDWEGILNGCVLILGIVMKGFFLDWVNFLLDLGVRGRLLFILGIWKVGNLFIFVGNVWEGILNCCVGMLGMNGRLKFVDWGICLLLIGNMLFIFEFWGFEF